MAAIDRDRSFRGLASRLASSLGISARKAETPAARITVRRAGEPGVAYHGGLNEQLLAAVPEDAARILEAGCGEGRLGAALRERKAGRIVHGIEVNPDAARQAAGRLDQVFVLDVERDLPKLAPGSLDLIIFGDVLEHLHDPGEVLRRYSRLLAPHGRVLCSVPNVQHHSVLSDLLQNEWQYQEAGLLDRTHLRFYTWASFTKLLLDAGLVPKILGEIPAPPSRRYLMDLRPMLKRLGVDPGLAARDLSTYQWIFEGRPLPPEDPADEEPLSFIACVGDESRFAANLASSPCFRGSTPHELITIRGAGSAAEGFELGRRQARNRIAVLVHQDVYLPGGWPRRFMSQWRQAEARFGPIGIAGVYGASFDPAAPGCTARAGLLVDRRTLLQEPATLPAPVETLDELLLALPRDTPLEAEPRLGWHFYGADLALQARGRGLRVLALDALCFHNSLNNYRLPAAFQRSARRFRKKWIRELPVATSCLVVRRS